LSRKKITAISCGVTLALVVTSTASAQLPAPHYSAVACDSYANSYAQRTSRQGQLLGGAAAGSLAGLAVGSLFAASGVGAVVGLTAGLLGGGAIRHQREQEIYQAAYQDCLAGRRP
jgi:predicted lipid-binding transport protein (Tim44 family)